MILRISTNPIAIPSYPHYNYKHANWDEFQTQLNTEHTPMPLENQHHTTIDALINTVQTDILKAADTHIPKTRFKIFHDFKPSIKTQRLLICYRNKLDTNKHNHLRVQGDLIILRQHILNSLHDDHDTHWHNIITDTQTHRTTDPTRFWRRIHCLRGIRKTRFSHLNINNTRVTDPTQITQAFKQHWEHVFQPHTLPLHEPSRQHIHTITQELNNIINETRPAHTIDTSTLTPDHILTTPIEEDEVASLLKRARRKAPGPSGITWIMARHLPPSIITTLTNIYNASLATGYFPIPFKTATTILIPKPNKDSHSPANYRPISLLELLGKTFERIINRRLRLHLDMNDLLSNKQFGFRQNRSTEGALNTIIAYLKKNQPHFKTALVTKDVKQAFDTVWHVGLKHQIFHDFDLPLISKRLLCNFLTERRTRIKHDSTFSSYFTPQAGIPQGSVISPTLFNMYTHKLPDPTHHDSLTLQYADDVTQLARSRTLDNLTDKLQTELTATSLWEMKWRIHSHPDKTTVTYFNIKRNPPRHIFLYPFLPNPVRIQRKTTNKALGLIIDQNLRFNQQIVQKTSIAKEALSNIHRFRDCSVKTKLHLYKALILPLLTYCPLALSLTTQTGLLNLQVVQNKALRFILNVKWYQFKTNEATHTEANLTPINITLHYRIMKQLENYSITQEDLYTFIDTLRPFNRNFPAPNILDDRQHPLPDPIYKRR